MQIAHEWYMNFGKKLFFAQYIFFQLVKRPILYLSEFELDEVVPS